MNGDGKIDQWWAFEGEKTTIAIDRNGDGRITINELIAAVSPAWLGRLDPRLVHREPRPGGARPGRSGPDWRCRAGR